MTPDTQYARARLAHQSQLPPAANKFHTGNGDDGKHYWLTPPDAPALFQVSRDGEALGTLTITSDGAHYGGFASEELAAALAMVRAAVTEGRR